MPTEIAVHETYKIHKTYKLYIDGKFTRSESGRTFTRRIGTEAVELPDASRKDARNAVRAALRAKRTWAGADAYLRGQILYRVAEMTSELTGALERDGAASGSPERAMARLVHHAGWADKLSCVLGSVNDTGTGASWSTPGPVGVVAAVLGENAGIDILAEIVGAALAAADTCVIVVGESLAPGALSFAQALHSGDVPAGVLNILTTQREEVADTLAAHQDVDAILVSGVSPELERRLALGGVADLKRFGAHDDIGDARALYGALTELRTVWCDEGR